MKVQKSPLNKGFESVAKEIQKAARNDTHILCRKKILTWYSTHGRHDLAWRENITFYKVLVSEIMLQQTQVTRVKEKFKSFLKKYPTIKKLAQASNQELLVEWSGLGYNRRALNLKRTVKELQHSNLRKKLSVEQLKLLPGIGDYTAHAITAFVYDKPALPFDTNLRSVAAYLFFPSSKKIVSDEILKKKLLMLMPQHNSRDWNYALMDFGQQLKQYNLAKKLMHKRSKQSTFKGSNREVRGNIIKLLAMTHSACSLQKIISLTKIKKERLVVVLDKLLDEGTLKKNKNGFSIA